MQTKYTNKVDRRYPLIGVLLVPSSGLYTTSGASLYVYLSCKRIDGMSSCANASTRDLAKVALTRGLRAHSGWPSQVTVSRMCLGMRAQLR